MKMNLQGKNVSRFGDRRHTCITIMAFLFVTEKNATLKTISDGALSQEKLPSPWSISLRQISAHTCSSRIPIL